MSEEVASVAPEAGAKSAFLDDQEKKQAASHAAPAALVIHEVVREEGEAELKRPISALIWSGLAAGLSMGFSLLCLGMMRAGLPNAPWAGLIDSFGYSVGFVIAVLGRQQLFTESTLTSILPLVTNRDGATLVKTLRLWLFVLAANLVGTAAFAFLVSVKGVLPDETKAAMVAIGREVIDGDVGPKIIRAVLAGWLIALMVWLLPSARSARLFVIILLTYVVALAKLPHIVAGSADAAFAVFSGGASARDFWLGFALPTLTGNTIGGVALTALLNHAPLSSEIQRQQGERADGAEDQREV